MDAQAKPERAIKTVEDAIRLVEASRLTHIKVGLSDIDGILRGKYLRKDKFLGALRAGSLSAMSYWVGTQTTRCTTMRNTLAGTPPIRTLWCASYLRAAGVCRWNRATAKICCSSLPNLLGMPKQFAPEACCNV